MTRDRIGALTGVLFVVVLILSFVIGGEPPDADEPVQEIVDHYSDNKDSVQVGAALSGLAAVLFVFFANHLRLLMRGTRTSAPILAGATIVAAGAGIDGTISFALAEAVDDIEPASVQALQALWDNDFLPLAIGLVVFLAGVGLAILDSGALPRWLGWIALALAVIGITPIGFAAFMGSLVLVLVLGVMLLMRDGGAEPPAPAPPAPGPPPSAA